MQHPYLTIDLDKIEHNARAITGLCRQHGIEVTGVTKVACGNPDVARAMLRGGVSSIGESHLENIQRLRAAGVATSYMLLQVPPLSGVDEVVESVDVSLNSELAVLEALSRAARRRGRVHEVILMVDLGDLREGIWPEDLVPFVREALCFPGIRIKGLGTNLACFGAVAPSEDNMKQLVELACEIERTFDLALEWISGSNSSGLELIASGRMPRRVNHARIGEGILLGRETIHRKPWPGTLQDAFVLHAEVLELRKKPSVPVGERCEDAFGKLPAFEDRGEVMRALLNVGREDVDVDGTVPVDRRIMILGGSSDYLVVDVTGAAGGVHVGDEITFSLKYGALLAAMTSEYVKKCPVKGGVPVATDDSRGGRGT
ncbi:MAG: alanine/ornithine racemase family PLP-dependent enzyme [Candidatus Binatia bacterium]